jgi:hypothetical protein
MKKFSSCVVLVFLLTVSALCPAQQGKEEAKQSPQKSQLLQSQAPKSQGMLSKSEVIKKLAGFWKLETFVRKGRDGQNAYPFGKDALGYIMYDTTGHMGVHIMRTGRQRPESGRGVAEGYMAYFGTYEILEKDGIIIHHMEGNTSPSLTGTDYIRYFEFKEDTLILTPTNRTDGKFNPLNPDGGQLTWRRLK